MNNTKPVLCPVCYNNDIKVFFIMENIPILCNALTDSYEAAICSEREDISLAFCFKCGHIFNTNFNPNNIYYDSNYNNSLFFSDIYLKYTKRLINDIMANHDLHGKYVFDIGCGDGAFLKLLCSLGYCYGFGFDPTIDSKTADFETGSKISFFKGYYDKSHQNILADLMCTRHVLEHVFDLNHFVNTLASGTNYDGLLVTEVPNVEYILENDSFFDIIYEHYNYFSEMSLSHILNRCGFDDISIEESFGRQYLLAKSRRLLSPGNHQQNNPLKLDSLFAKACRFSEDYKSTVSNWEQIIDKYSTMNSKIFIWGAGSKGIMFLNMIKNNNSIYKAVDINPNKTNKYIPGTGHEVVYCDTLNFYKPDVIINMNNIYLDEIKRSCKSLNLHTEIINIS